MSEEKKLTLAQAADNIGQNVLAAIEEKQNKGLVFPEGYNVQNAVTSAMFQIKNTVNKEKKPALAVCKIDTVKQAIWDMASKGLDPNKNHCYWIVYGDTLSMFESYFGLQYRAKRADPNIDKIYAEVVYESDTFKYELEDGAKVVTVHEQDPDNIDLTKIKGAYATIKYKDGSTRSEYMTMKQIQNSWARGQTKGASDAHKLAPEQMAKRTVLNRLCKVTVNTETESALLRDTIAREIDEEAEENEATEMIDITDNDIEKEEEPEQPKKAENKQEQQELPFDS